MDARDLTYQRAHRVPHHPRIEAVGSPAEALRLVTSALS